MRLRQLAHIHGITAGHCAAARRGGKHARIGRRGGEFLQAGVQAFRSGLKARYQAAERAEGRNLGLVAGNLGCELVDRPTLDRHQLRDEGGDIQCGRT